MNKNSTVPVSGNKNNVFCENWKINFGIFEFHNFLIMKLRIRFIP